MNALTARHFKIVRAFPLTLYLLLLSSVLLPLLLQALYTNSSINERCERVEEEDHTYELLLTAQTKVPPPSQESQSHKGKCVLEM